MTAINWYPGHMAKTKKIIKEKIDLIDIIYEVVDARIPLSSKIKDVEEYIKSKPRILIMTKTDLCDTNETNKWISHYEILGYKVIGMDLMNKPDLEKILSTTKELLTSFDEKREAKGMNKRAYRALIIGIPNVGKSTLINRLVGKKAAKVGNMPGITKSLDWIRINKEIELLDSPGILWPKLDNETVAFNLASMTAIREEVLPIDEVSVYILRMMTKYYPSALEERYGVKDIDFEELIPTFDLIGKKRGCMLRGGEVDYKKVASLIIKDLNDGSLGKVTFDRYHKE